VNVVMMNPVRDPGELVAAPLGGCAVGPHGVYWCGAPDLIGAIVWGTLDDASVRDLALLFALMAHGRLAARRRVLIDARAITRVDSDTLTALIERARARRPLWSASLEQLVLVIPDGVPGMLLAGALSSIASCPMVRAVHDLDEALALLAHPTARAAHDLAAAHARRTDAGSELLSRLRAVLARDLADTTVERCASALGLSVRSLQRHLGRHATSFSDELRRARVSAAQELIEHTEAKIDSIAARVGLGNASRLSATMRRELDLTPGQLRARARMRLAA
jgi:AraC-like DNA-binding protein